MKVKLTASCVWNVSVPDEKIAQDLMHEEPKDIILDYLQDALKGDEELTNFKVSVEQVDTP